MNINTQSIIFGFDSEYDFFEEIEKKAESKRDAKILDSIISFLLFNKTKFQFSLTGKCSEEKIEKKFIKFERMQKWYSKLKSIFFVRYENKFSNKFDKISEIIKEYKLMILESLLKNEIKSNENKWCIHKFYYISEAVNEPLINKSIDFSDSDKFKELQEMATYGVAMSIDGYKESFICDLIQARLELRRSSVLLDLPKKMIFKDVKKGILECYGTDNELLNNATLYHKEKGMRYGCKFSYQSLAGFRGTDGFSKKFFNYLNNMNGNSSFIDKWFQEQAGSSYNIYTVTVADWLLNQRKEYIGKGKKEKNALLRQKFYMGPKNDLLDLCNPNLINPDIEITLKIWMALQMEILLNIELPGVDKDRRTIKLYRTENASYMPKDARHETFNCMRRFPVASGSIGDPVQAVAGGEKTEQEVDFHRILGLFILPKSNGFPLYLRDDQKECLFVTGQIPFYYKSD